MVRGALYLPVGPTAHSSVAALHTPTDDSQHEPEGEGDRLQGPEIGDNVRETPEDSPSAGDDAAQGSL